LTPTQPLPDQDAPRPNPRQIAFLALKAVHLGAYADVALERALQPGTLDGRDRRLVTELVYGSVRRQRTLDALVDQLARKPAKSQPPALRTILHLGLYQLGFLTQVPAAAAVNTTVELAKANGFQGLARFVNGILRQYSRLAKGRSPTAILDLPEDPAPRLGICHSYPDWIVQVWAEQIGWSETEQLCLWFNQAPAIDLRVNPRQASWDQVAAALGTAGIATSPVAGVPQALRLQDRPGSIQALPGFAEGWWMVQDSSAQLVSQVLNPQPGETIIDACAAPGGKALHIAELMQDQGTLWACDRSVARLRKLRQNAKRLRVHSIQTWVGDSRDAPQFQQQADRVLVDAPCSGLGTLHRHADARWRQSPTTMAELAQLQGELCDQAATWVKPGGILVYATCTLDPQENAAVVQEFVARHPDWQVVPPDLPVPLAACLTPEGWLQVWPHRHGMDGFFVACLQHQV